MPNSQVTPVWYTDTCIRYCKHPFNKQHNTCTDFAQSYKATTHPPQLTSKQQQLALQCSCLHALLADVKHLQLIAAMKTLN